MRHPLDAAVMSGALWLLAAMLIDVLTPKELAALMVGEVLAPAAIAGAVFYHIKLPGLELAIALATLWLVSSNRDRMDHSETDISLFHDRRRGAVYFGRRMVSWLGKIAPQNRRRHRGK
jgi:hypothetical protein